MYVYVWEFRVRPDAVDEFLTHYGPDGSWATLFREAEGYVDTRLLRDQNDPARFVTVDTWRSAEDHDAFKRSRSRDLGVLDRHCESLTVTETWLGDFDTVEDPGTGGPA